MAPGNVHMLFLPGQTRDSESEGETIEMIRGYCVNLPQELGNKPRRESA